MNVRLSPEQKVRVLNSQDIYKIMQQILLRENKIRRNQEHFWVVGLNNTNKILFIELVSLGAANRLEVGPPEVFRMAIYKLAVKIIMVHNHPSGSTDLSPADKDHTARMIKAGEIVKIDVIDHLVITEEKYTSLGDLGIIQKLKQSNLYQLLDRDKVILKEMTVKIEKAKERELALKMKKKGYSVEEIQELTGLKKAEINKL